MDGIGMSSDLKLTKENQKEKMVRECEEKCLECYYPR